MLSNQINCKSTWHPKKWKENILLHACISGRLYWNIKGAHIAAAAVCKTYQVILNSSLQWNQQNGIWINPKRTMTWQRRIKKRNLLRHLFKDQVIQLKCPKSQHILMIFDRKIGSWGIFNTTHIRFSKLKSSENNKQDQEYSLSENLGCPYISLVLHESMCKW